MQQATTHDLQQQFALLLMFAGFDRLPNLAAQLLRLAMLPGRLGALTNASEIEEGLQIVQKQPEGQP